MKGNALVVLVCLVVLPIAALPYSVPTVKGLGAGTVVFDYSHGQTKASLLNNTDLWLKNNLTQMGYTVVWATGGINASILENAVGFVAGSIYGEANVYSVNELIAISNWFNAGERFMWIGYDSDFGGYTYINDYMTMILMLVGSHVYGEPTAVQDPISNCGSSYRVVANGTSTDPYVSSIVTNVHKVLMHGPTLLLGSNNATPGYGISPVALETTTITDVYPLLYYGGNATILDSEPTPPIAHADGARGEFVAATIETHAGMAKTGVLVVSGASPYGDYVPMYQDVFYGVELDGYNLVNQAIDFGVRFAASNTTTTTTTTTSTTTTTTFRGLRGAGAFWPTPRTPRRRTASTKWPCPRSGSTPNEPLPEAGGARSRRATWAEGTSCSPISTWNGTRWSTGSVTIRRNSARRGIFRDDLRTAGVRRWNPGSIDGCGTSVRSVGAREQARPGAPGTALP